MATNGHETRLHYAKCFAHVTSLYYQVEVYDGQCASDK